MKTLQEITYYLQNINDTMIIEDIHCRQHTIYIKELICMYEEAGVTAFVMKQENGSCQNIQTVGCPKDKLPDYGFTDKPESIC